MEIQSEVMLNCIQSVHYLVYEYYPQEVPFAVRVNAALAEVEDLFEVTIPNPMPNRLPEGDHPTVSEEGLIEWVSDYAFRPLGGGSWAMVDITDGEPVAVLTPA